jgi:hypothetical protein
MQFDPDREVSNLGPPLSENDQSVQRSSVPQQTKFFIRARSELPLSALASIDMVNGPEWTFAYCSEGRLRAKMTLSVILVKSNFRQLKFVERSKAAIRL